MAFNCIRDEIVIRVIRSQAGGWGRLLENKLHPASSRSQPVIIQARYSGRMSIISRAHALLGAAGNFLNERNSAATRCVFPRPSSAISPADMLIQKSGEWFSLFARRRCSTCSLRGFRCRDSLWEYQRTDVHAKSPRRKIAHWRIRICADGPFGSTCGEQVSTAVSYFYDTLLREF